MAQGYKWRLLIDSAESNYKNIDIELDAPPIDASARIDPVTNSANEGFSSKLKDLSTLRVEINALMKPGGTLPNIEEGPQTAAWSIAYNGVTMYSGAQLYVQRYSYSGSVPGETRVRLLFFANGKFNRTTRFPQ